MSEHKGFYIRTFTGRRYYPADPRAEDISLEDIAHHLSMLCRFTGAVSRFYSVAEHSVLVSKVVPPEHAFAGLMHDAVEAYLGDVSRPVKQMLPDYKALEAINWKVMAERFGLPYKLPPCIKEADIAVYYAERAELMPPGDVAADSALTRTIPESVFIEPAKVEVQALRGATAEITFLERLREIAPDVFYNDYIANRRRV